MAEGTVNALWVGPHEAVTPDGTVLVPGETEVEISAGEAEASAHWKVKGAKPKRAGKSAAEKKAQADARKAKRAADRKAAREAKAAAERQQAEKTAAAAEHREQAAELENS